MGPALENPNNDPQFRLWEEPVRAWLARQNIREETMADIPKEYDDIHKPEYAPKLNIISPISGTIYNPVNPININFTHQSRFNLDQVDFFFNNIYLGSSNSEPFSFTFTPAGLEVWEDNSAVRIVAYDEVRNKTETTIPVQFKILNP